MQYLDQYIAMHNGRLVDHDKVFATLRQRVREKYGRQPEMMTLVAETPEPVFLRRGFRIESA